MKGMRFTLSLVLAVAVAAVAITAFWPHSGHAAAPGQTATTTARTISAWGHAEIAVKPDQVSMVLGVQTRNRVARTALTNNDARINAVIGALTKQGVARSHIQTYDLSIWYDNQSNVYVVTHNLGVKLDRVDRVAAGIDAAIRAGANSSFGVNFGMKDSSTARASALKAAVADARKRATTLAQAVGGKLNQTISVDEATSAYVINKGGGMGGGGGGGGGTPIQPGQYIVSADVSVTYSYG